MPPKSVHKPALSPPWGRWLLSVDAGCLRVAQGPGRIEIIFTTDGCVTGVVLLVEGWLVVVKKAEPQL